MKLPPLIEIEELFEIYNNQNVMIFDSSNGLNAKKNYEAKHLKGAIFVDLNSQLSSINEDISIGGRHPLPPINVFAQTLMNLGISRCKHVIIYDDKNGSNAAARFWWMLRAIGHEKVQVLNGGLKQAIKSNFPLSSEKEKIKSCSEQYQTENWLLPTVDRETVKNIAQDPNFLVIDVRDKERYEGLTEPIDLIAGHIPGAINFPFTENLDKEGKFLVNDVLKSKYTALLNGFDNENIIVHCGSGVTACHTLLALEYAGFSIPKLYVGSWSEWSRNI